MERQVVRMGRQARTRLSEFVTRELSLLPYRELDLNRKFPGIASRLPDPFFINLTDRAIEPITIFFNPF